MACAVGLLHGGSIHKYGRQSIRGVVHDTGYYLLLTDDGSFGAIPTNSRTARLVNWACIIDSTFL
jgi:hypothetical protein